MTDGKMNRTPCFRPRGPRGLTHAFALLLALAPAIDAAIFYVSPRGDDGNAGTERRPWATLAGARERIRASGRLGREPIHVVFAAGTYYVGRTVTFSATDSGSANAPVLYEAAPDAVVVLSGGERLSLAWQLDVNGVYVAPLPADIRFDQLYAAGQLQRMARYPNYDASVAVFGGYAVDAISPERAARWADPGGGYIHAMHRHLWGDFHYRITGKQPDGTLQYEGGWQNNRQMGMHNRFRFVENIREELDAPGEWFHDQKGRRLYWIPPAGVDVRRAVIEVSRLRELIDVRGTPMSPVRFLGFRGFIFRHTERTFMETREPLLRSDWCIYRGGAVRFEGAENCTVDECEFDHVGGNAIFVSAYNRRLAFRSCWIHDGGGSGVCFVGSPQAVRNPLFEYEQRLARAAIDSTPGPLTDDYPAECRVENCLIRRIGRVEKQVAAVEIAMARQITVSQCTICEVPRAGINIGDGTWGGHVIEGCDVFDTVLETGDHGSFNSWGRDRYWGVRDTTPQELSELALLDAVEPTVIRRSRWRCDRGWDIDLDDGSSNYEIYENLLVGGGLKLREGFRRHAWNNVIVNNSLHPHVWYSNSGDTFTHNIIMGRYRPADMRVATWGRELDYNFFTTSDTDRVAYTAKGCDAHSVVGDARFVDPANGDFRVRDDSPALTLGFRNFSMDQFGVREPRLRALASTPKIPAVRIPVTAVAAAAFEWLGAELRNLQGEEYSAFGLSAEAGGVLVLNAPGHAEAVALGLRTGDVLVSVNDAPAKTADDLTQLVSAKVEAGPVKLGVRREQKDTQVVLPVGTRPPRRLDGK